MKVLVDSFFLDEEGNITFEMDVDRLKDHPNIDLVFMKPKSMLKNQDLKDCDIFFGIAGITKETLGGVEGLKHVAKFGAGFENTDIQACTEKGIMVTHTPLAVMESVVQFVLTHILTLACHYREVEPIIRKGGWYERLDYMATQIKGMTLGIIGFGNIGRKVAEVVKPFEMRVLVHDPYTTEERLKKGNAESVDLMTLFKESDFISINCLVTPETKGMIKIEHLKAMKKTAYLINTARGGIYSDADLAKVLKEGRIAGAAIDVYENEPYTTGIPNVLGNPLLEGDNYILFPHQAGSTAESLKNCISQAIDAVIKTADGEVPDFVINYEVLKDPEVREAKKTTSFVYDYR